MTFGMTSTAATTTWTAWNQAQYSGTQTTAGWADQTWAAWNDSGTSASTVTVTLTSAAADSTWRVWVRQGLGGQVYVEQAPRRPTAEEQRREAEWREEQKRISAQAKAESERAMKLLREYLDEQQRKQLDASGEFEVESQNGNRYAIKKGVAGNVFRLDDRRKPVTRYCIHPIENVPDGDAMLGQLCWLKWNEEQFLKVANATRLAA